MSHRCAIRPEARPGLARTRARVRRGAPHPSPSARPPGRRPAPSPRRPEQGLRRARVACSGGAPAAPPGGTPRAPAEQGRAQRVRRGTSEFTQRVYEFPAEGTAAAVPAAAHPGSSRRVERLGQPTSSARALCAACRRAPPVELRQLGAKLRLRPARQAGEQGGVRRGGDRRAPPRGPAPGQGARVASAQLVRTPRRPYFKDAQAASGSAARPRRRTIA